MNLFESARLSAEKKIESGYIFFGDSADERKINIFAKIFAAEKTKELFFFFKKNEVKVGC